MLECKTAPFAPIAAGDKLPDGELTYLDDDGKLQKHMMYDLARDKKVVIFGVPGAFTPTCRYLTLPSLCFLVHIPQAVLKWKLIVGSMHEASHLTNKNPT